MVHLLDDDPFLMSPEQRLRAIAALLALGFQRFKAKGGSAPPLLPEPSTKPSLRKETAHDCH